MAKKLYYKIGEACKRLDIQPYVLRYWETEFPALSPSKSKSGQRVYSEEDVRVIHRIKELLYEEGYTIAGAKKKLETEDLSNLREPAPPAPKAPKTPKTSKTSNAPKQKVEPSEPAEASNRAAKSKDRTKKMPGKPATKPSKSQTTVTREPPNKRSQAGSSDAAALRKGLREALKEAKAILKILER